MTEKKTKIGNLTVEIMKYAAEHELRDNEVLYACELVKAGILRRATDFLCIMQGEEEQKKESVKK